MSVIAPGRYIPKTRSQDMSGGIIVPSASQGDQPLRGDWLNSDSRDRSAEWKSGPVVSVAVAKLVRSIWFFFFATLGGALLRSAGEPAYGQEPIAAPLAREETQKNPAASCLEPPPLLRWQDYDGPFTKIAGSLAKKWERKTAHSPHPPHFKPGDVLCSLEPRAKFRLFVSDTLDPISFVSSGFNAGLAQAANSDPTFGQGARGYARRFGADFGASTSSRFLGFFLYPTVFAQDPRYYRLHHAGTGTRLLHAMRHTVVAHRDNGKLMFNFTKWMGTASSVVLGNLFHPGNASGVAAGFRAGAYSMVQDMGMDVLREFWPDMARKLKLPFRGMEYEQP